MGVVERAGAMFAWPTACADVLVLMFPAHLGFTKRGIPNVHAKGDMDITWGQTGILPDVVIFISPTLAGCLCPERARTVRQVR